jgi:hypothetical protein
MKQVCEGRMVSHIHKDDEREYQLFDKEGKKDTKGWLCSRCVESDIRRGFDWRPISLFKESPK